MVVLAVLMSFVGLGGIAYGSAAAMDMPGPCCDLGIGTAQDSIMLNGTLPDNYEEAGIKGIHIYRGTDPWNMTLHHTLKVYNGTARSFLYQDTGISNGVTYYYSVAAFNELGDGNRSEVLNATCLGAPPAPRDLTASVACDHVHLNWYPPVSDGGSPLTHYSVLRGLRGCEPVLIANVTCCAYDDYDIAFNDSYYNYEVRAVNEHGAGKMSMTVFASLPMPVVSGRLTGTDGGPVAGAFVEVDGNGMVACTDANGSFSIAMAPGPHILTIWLDGNAVDEIELVTPAVSKDLGAIPIDDRGGSGANAVLEIVAFGGIIAVVTTGMFIWATGKVKIR